MVIFDKAQGRALVFVLTLLKGLGRESRSSYMHGFPKKYGPSLGFRGIRIVTIVHGCLYWDPLLFRQPPT